MVTLKDWMEVVNYRITEGSDYCWDCYGPHAYSLDSWNGDPNGYSFTITFDQKTQEVYEVQAHDYKRQRAYRMINPDYVKKHNKECKQKNVNLTEAWEDVDYVSLELDEDFLEKARAIYADTDYDTGVLIPLDLPDDELMVLFKLAHKANMTFNEYVEQALRTALDDPEFVNRLKDKAKS